jgi:hypothetical protein
MKISRCRWRGLIAVCRQHSGQVICLEPWQILLLALDWGGLRDQLAETLKITPSDDAIDPAGETIALGVRRGGRHHIPVMLVRTRFKDNAERHIERIGYHAKKPTVVLTPTRTHWSSQLLEFCDAHQVALMSLDESVDLVGGCWVATEAWDRQIQTMMAPRRKRPAKAGHHTDKKLSPTEKKELLLKELKKQVQQAAEQVQFLVRAGAYPRLPDRITKGKLAELAGVAGYDVSRYLDKDERLSLLWNKLLDLETLLRMPIRR